ncbi:alpha-amylase family glycosyl hydrolase [Terracidiphilus gabretensis]|uniref:alpha-amylase family glycosyl hydrolase n=1 Tax=Terracidiphilus gabretensis TaxID=1577687 RepID=UPI00071BACD0|nr:alpha-amylase family glycosyl hydrolase [Terracidiphilus gabretensis]
MKPGSRLSFRLFLATLLLAPISFAQSAKPVITKIDPPNWFAGLPPSLLLIHGEHLENTTFSIRAKSGSAHPRITETTISPNGHWAFVNFDPGKKPGAIQLIATNPRGSTTALYTLTARRPQSQGPRGFNSSDVMYLIMPDRFADADPTNDALPNFRDPDDRSRARAYHGGDIRGIEAHLDYLQQLGVTTIWTTPLYDNSAEQSGNSYHGYSATDMYAVDPHLGTMADLQSLVRAAHARGMKVVLDTVPNHVGAAHPWAKDMPTPDWFHGTPASHIQAQYDFLSIVNPDGNAVTRNAVLNGWFANSLPDLNQDSPLVALYLTQNAIWWIETAGIDGLRIDTFPYVPRSFWHTYNGTLRQLYPQISEVGEVFDGDPKVTSFFAGGRANRGSDGTVDTLLDTPFDYPMFFALRDALTRRKPMTAIAEVLKQDALYPHPERLVTFLGNHDNKRFLSESGADPAALRLGFGLLATLRGMPQLYYGDEIAMTGGNDPDNRHDFPGGFPQAKSDQPSQAKSDAFTQSGRMEAEQSMEAWVSSLLQLRAHTPALQTGQLAVLSADDRTLAFIRGTNLSSACSQQPRYIIAVNSDSVPHDITIPLDTGSLINCSRFIPALETTAEAHSTAGGKLQIHLLAQQIVILRAEK